ncbi:hypothetical protein K438DRAFT_1983131 [Mycena galopus ATCC 62051]|nr:hypothetical protein K438DRAFT_1983131 [Mycena galopus ATCC 62051]
MAVHIRLAGATKYVPPSLLLASFHASIALRNSPRLLARQTLGLAPRTRPSLRLLCSWPPPPPRTHRNSLLRSATLLRHAGFAINSHSYSPTQFSGFLRLADLAAVALAFISY